MSGAKGSDGLFSLHSILHIAHLVPEGTLLKCWELHLCHFAEVSSFK